MSEVYDEPMLTISVDGVNIMNKGIVDPVERVRVQVIVPQANSLKDDVKEGNQLVKFANSNE